MKRNTGNFVIIVLVLLNLVVWLVFPPVNDGRENFARQYAAEIIGSNNIILMACSLFLSTRPKWAEKYFGGLDKMYVTHRHTGTAAFLLIFAHVLTVPITTTGWRLGNYLGVMAFMGIVTIVLITLAPRIPFLNKLTGGDYNDWKKFKRYIGIFFILAFIHALTVPNPLDAFIAINWVQIFFIIGTASYLYTEVFGQFFKKYLPYTVEAVNHPNQSTTEVVLRAKKDTIQKQRAGQFLFVRFIDKGLDESHPFTISSAPHEDVLRLTVKACGDFTRDLFANLKAGTEAMLEGAYGMFDYKTGGEKQIWVAGGIGVTPFLSFIRDMNGELNHDVDFYYTVRHREEAVFVDEIEETAIKNPRLQARLRFSSTDGSLTVADIIRNAGGDIRGHAVYMCGPLPMVQAFEKKFIEAGVAAGNIHFEEFNFR
ncbi:MAG: ferric reductase-like transmembrane domain-containing protein [Anaerolineales bacterium]|nr:ferric reductase-like transmembrane domain-containing protein [Anaerolineales bacterium]